MTRIDAEEILRAEVHHNKNLMRSVRALTGICAVPASSPTWCSPGTRSAPSGTTVEPLSVRLVVFSRAAAHRQEIPSKDIRGDAQGADGAVRSHPADVMSAFGGIGWEDNPLKSVPARPPRRMSNVIDPVEPKRVAGFGPLSRGWLDPQRPFGAEADRKALDRPIAEVSSRLRLGLIPAGADRSAHRVPHRGTSGS
jgi:hypothetical protein